MTNFLKICTIAVALIFPALLVNASNGKGQQPHARAFELPDHDPIGRPGRSSAITRTVEITIKETESGYMLFEPDAIQIEHGSVVRFSISNPGQSEHEFFLGSFDEVAKHQQWMRNHPDMRHDDPNAVLIPSGESGELVWEFSEMTNLEFVCLIPGHREAGMWGVIIVHDHLSRNKKD